MPVTNEDIMKKLDRIELVLQNIASAEEKIEQEEEKELSELDEELNLEFNNMEDWRKYIWEGCPFKVEKSTSTEVDFFCKKKNDPCRFEGCPLNLKMEK
jgi:hypothetical protein